MAFPKESDPILSLSPCFGILTFSDSKLSLLFPHQLTLHPTMRDGACDTYAHSSPHF